MEIEHTADRAFRVKGKDLKTVFLRAAKALFQLQGQRALKTTEISREVQVQGFDRETLLVNWLNEILYLQESQDETYGEVEILEVTDRQLTAILKGEPGGRGRRVIKAATFHGLQIKKTSRGWQADIVVDV